MKINWVFIKIDVKDNNVEQAIRVLRKLQKRIFKVKKKILMKNPLKKKKYKQKILKNKKTPKIKK